MVVASLSTCRRSVFSIFFEVGMVLTDWLEFGLVGVHENEKDRVKIFWNQLGSLRGVTTRGKRGTECIWPRG